MRGRVTRRGLSRWSGTGGSDRTLPRFCQTRLPWCHLPWLLSRQHVWDADEGVVMRGEYVVVPTSGQTTSGCERFFASLYGKAVPGRCVLRLSLRRVKRRTSSPVVPEHVEKTGEAAAPAQPTPPARGPRGRPQGRKPRHRREVERRPSRRCIQKPMQRWLPQSGAACKVVDGLWDGELGPNEARPRGRQVGRHVVAKLREHSALSLPSAGPEAGRGPRRQ
jgi:putative transposase